MVFNSETQNRLAPPRVAEALKESFQLLILNFLLYAPDFTNTFGLLSKAHTGL